MNDDQLLLDMYKIQISRSEHFERLRASLATVVLVVAAALVGISRTGDLGIAQTLVLSGCLILLGAFGYVAANLHSERAQKHGDVAAAYRTTLLRNHEGTRQARATVRSDTDVSATDGVVRGKRTNINNIWSLAPIGIVVAAIAIAALELLAPPGSPG